MALYDDAIPTLAALRERGLTIGVATGRWHDPACDLEVTGLAEYVDVSFHAGMLRAQKDEPAYWENLLRRARLPASKVALVDDNWDAVETARRGGLRSFFIRRLDAPFAEVRRPDISSLAEIPTLLGVA